MSHYPQSQTTKTAKKFNEFNLRKSIRQQPQMDGTCDWEKALTKMYGSCTKSFGKWDKFGSNKVTWSFDKVSKIGSDSVTFSFGKVDKIGSKKVVRSFDKVTHIGDTKI
jgi:hypothetical protein